MTDVPVRHKKGKRHPLGAIIGKKPCLYCGEPIRAKQWRTGIPSVHAKCVWPDDYNKDGTANEASL